MGKFLIDISAATNNIQVSSDGSVWANYLLTPPNVTPYDTDSLENGQSVNAKLLNGISNMATSDVLLLGVKVAVSADEAANKIVRGIPNLSDYSYPHLQEMVKGFRNWHLSKHKEYRRVFWLSVKLAASVGDEGRGVLSKSGALSALAGIKPDVVRQQEMAVLQEIPSSLKPMRCSPQHLVWLHDRMRQRGLTVPELPSASQLGGGFNPRGFQDVSINKVADADHILDAFIDRVDRNLAPKVRKTKIGQYRARYKTARWGQALAVHSPATRNENFPDGVGAYQTLFAIGSWPEKPDLTLNTFTYLVDQDLGALDADFAIRLVPSQEMVSTKHVKGFSNTLAGEAEANSRDEYDLEDYGGRDAEARKLRAGMRSESGGAPRGFLVTAIFALAHPNPRVLKQGVSAVLEQLAGEDFTPHMPTAGQFDLLRQMMPGSVRSELVTDLAGVTSARKFGACIPVRRTEIGDPVGIPWAINKENQLGQVVYEDIFNASERGSNSKTITGRQGSGKTQLIKYTLAWMSAMRLPWSLIDQDDDGEGMVFASQLTDVQPVHVVHPDVSMCPLRVFADEPARGQEVWLELMQGLLGLSLDSPEMLLARQLTDPHQRQMSGINSSRDVLRALQSGGAGSSAAAASLRGKLEFWAGIGFTAALFDPMGAHGFPQTLPVWEPKVKSLVWRTSGLKPNKGALTEDTPYRERFATVMFTLIAHLTSYHFSRYLEPCGFFGDEMKFLEGTSALDAFEKRDRQGRKVREFVVAASQGTDEVNRPEFALITQKVILAQGSRDNALKAFTYADIPATPGLVKRMLTDTSPLDGDTKQPEKGREGEGWFVDGFGGKARIQTLPMPLERLARYANTRPSERIRASDLTAADYHHAQMVG